MSSYLALAVSVGVLAVVATWLFFYDPVAAANLQVWQAFIAWGCHYHCGRQDHGHAQHDRVHELRRRRRHGGRHARHAPRRPLGQFAAPVAVGLGATVICLASKVPFLAVIPASVYGFASIAGLFLLNANMTPTTALLPTILSVIIGAAFGYVSEALAGALTKKR